MHWVSELDAAQPLPAPRPGMRQLILNWHDAFAHAASETCSTKSNRAAMKGRRKAANIEAQQPLRICVCFVHHADRADHQTEKRLSTPSQRLSEGVPGGGRGGRGGSTASLGVVGRGYPATSRLRLDPLPARDDPLPARDVLSSPQWQKH